MKHTWPKCGKCERYHETDETRSVSFGDLARGELFRYIMRDGVSMIYQKLTHEGHTERELDRLVYRVT